MKSQMEYLKLNEITKTYIDNAIDIYMSIQNKEISVFDKFSNNHKKNLTQIDKKIISLFISGLVTKSEAQKVIFNYDDIKLEKLFEFVNLPLKSAKQDGIDYEKCYENDFRVVIESALRNSYKPSTISYISPELILSTFCNQKKCGSNVLYNFANKNQIYLDINLFNLLKYEAQKNGSILESNNIKEENNESNLSDNNILILDMDKQKLKNEKLETIKKMYVGQEEFTEKLFCTIYNNQKIISLGEKNCKLAVIFVDGPTGTGKTAISKEIANTFGLPFVSTAINNYSSTGYVGADLTEILARLYMKSGKNLELAQRGIVLLDEFDKICYNNSRGLNMHQAIQFQLLDFMDGGNYEVNVNKGLLGEEKIEFNTSNLTFICCAALTALREEKTKKSQSIGFGKCDYKNDIAYDITQDDLVNNGYEKELVGRLNTFLPTNAYTVSNYVNIARNSTKSPILGLCKNVELYDKELYIEDKTYQVIANHAYKLKTGARGLQTIANDIRTKYISELVLSDIKTITLTPSIVDDIVKNKTLRKNN